MTTTPPFAEELLESLNQFTTALKEGKVKVLAAANAEIVATLHRISSMAWHLAHQYKHGEDFLPELEASTVHATDALCSLEALAALTKGTN